MYNYVINMRKQRLKEIQRILSQDNIGSQEVLLSKLNECGINITQATLSRDISHLKVGKFFIPNLGYIYVLPQDIKRLESKPNISASSLIGVISIVMSKNIAVVHTISGYATQICVNIDNAKIPEIIGTIAGDDTIMIVIDENVSQDGFKKAFIEMFPELKDRI